MTTQPPQPDVRPWLNSNREFVGVSIHGTRKSLNDLAWMDDQARVHLQIIEEQRALLDEMRQRLHAVTIEMLHGLRKAEH